MRLGPPGTDSGALSRSRNRQVNPLDAPPHPQKSFYLTPISTPMGYQVIVLAFRYLFASICRGAAGRPRWFWPELVLRVTPRRTSWPGGLRGRETSIGPALRGGGWGCVIVASPLVPAPAGVLVPELRTARENARLEIGSQRGRNSHQIGVLGIYDLQGLSYGRTELLVADMRLLAPDPSGTPRVGRCQ